MDGKSVALSSAREPLKFCSAGVSSWNHRGELLCPNPRNFHVDAGMEIRSFREPLKFCGHGYGTRLKQGWCGDGHTGFSRKELIL